MAMNELRKEVEAAAMAELNRANAKFPLFNSTHEGYAVILEEAVTCKCECDAAKKYAESKERVQKAKSRITELFGSTAERPIDQDVVTVMLNVVDAIEAKHMKGITIDVGQDVKAKVSKMAKESIKVERSETSKKIYEE